MKKNGYDSTTGALTLPVGDHGFFDREQVRWARYFQTPAENGGLRRNAITDDGELKALNAFFAWATWATVAERPGANHSYTNNFPYDPLAGNYPTAGTLIWSAVGIIFLLGATGLVLLAFGFFSDLGWHGVPDRPTGTMNSARDSQLGRGREVRARLSRPAGRERSDGRIHAERIAGCERSGVAFAADTCRRCSPCLNL